MSATTWFIIAIVGFSLSGAALIAAVLLFIKLRIPAVIGDLNGKTVAREIKEIRETGLSGTEKRRRPGRVQLEQNAPVNSANNVAMNADDIKQAHASKRLDKIDNLSSDSGQRSRTKSLPNEAQEVSPSTGVLSNSIEHGSATEVMPSGRATEVMQTKTEVAPSGRATEVLTNSVPTAPAQAGRATEILSNNAPAQAGRATEVLSNNAPAQTGRATEVLGNTTPATEVLSNNIPAANATSVLSAAEETPAAPARQLVFELTRNKVVIHTDEVVE